MKSFQEFKAASVKERQIIIDALPVEKVAAFIEQKTDDPETPNFLHWLLLENIFLNKQFKDSPKILKSIEQSFNQLISKIISYAHQLDKPTVLVDQKSQPQINHPDHKALPTTKTPGFIWFNQVINRGDDQNIFLMQIFAQLSAATFKAILTLIDPQTFNSVMADRYTDHEQHTQQGDETYEFTGWGHFSTMQFVDHFKAALTLADQKTFSTSMATQYVEYPNSTEGDPSNLTVWSRIILRQPIENINAALALSTRKLFNKAMAKQVNHLQQTGWEHLLFNTQDRESLYKVLAIIDVQTFNATLANQSAFPLIFNWDLHDQILNLVELDKLLEKLDPFLKLKYEKKPILLALKDMIEENLAINEKDREICKQRIETLHNAIFSPEFIKKNPDEFIKIASQYIKNSDWKFILDKWLPVLDKALKTPGFNNSTQDQLNALQGRIYLTLYNTPNKRNSAYHINAISHFMQIKDPKSLTADDNLFISSALLDTVQHAKYSKLGNKIPATPNSLDIKYESLSSHAIALALGGQSNYLDIEYHALAHAAHHIEQTQPKIAPPPQKMLDQKDVKSTASIKPIETDDTLQNSPFITLLKGSVLSEEKEMTAALTLDQIKDRMAVLKNNAQDLSLIGLQALAKQISIKSQALQHYFEKSAANRITAEPKAHEKSILVENFLVKLSQLKTSYELIESDDDAPLKMQRLDEITKLIKSEQSREKSAATISLFFNNRSEGIWFVDTLKLIENVKINLENKILLIQLQKFEKTISMRPQAQHEPFDDNLIAMCARIKNKLATVPKNLQSDAAAKARVAILKGEIMPIYQSMHQMSLDHKSSALRTERLNVYMKLLEITILKKIQIDPKQWVPHFKIHGAASGPGPK